jgi:hypothetical protein
MATTTIEKCGTNSFKETSGVLVNLRSRPTWNGNEVKN